MKPCQDYSFVRGINFEYHLDAPERWHNDLALGQRVGLNSVRVWLSYPLYKKDPGGYFAKIKQFFRACADAEKISERLVGNYTKKYELPTPMATEDIPDRNKDEKQIAGPERTEASL